MPGKIAFSMVCVALAACAPLPTKPGFDEVQALLSARLPLAITWPQTEDERRVHQVSVAAQLNSPLTLDSVLRIGLTNNPRLQANYEKLGIVYGDLVQAGLPANPSLGFSLHSSSIGIGRELNIAQDLLSLLTLAPRKRLAAAQFDETKLTTAQQVLGLATDLKKAYFTAHADQAALLLTKEVTEAAAVAAELADRQSQAGNIGTRELALRQEFHARAVLDSSRQELALAQSREHLARLMGLRRDQREWTLADIALDVIDTIPELNALETTALNNRYDISAGKNRIARLADSLGLANRFRYLSVLGLGLSYARETDGERLRGPSIALGLPLWDRGQGNRLRMQAELREGERNLEALALDVIGDVRNAYARVENANQSIQHFRKTLLPLHDRITAETLKFYNGMLLGAYDLLLARQNQLNAQRDYIETLKSYWLAKVDLEHAAGGASLGKTMALDNPVPKIETPPAEHKHH
jgi:outer membrane protein, heavy metal efflux system